VHQFLKDVHFYFRDLGSSALRAWDRFFFTPADPTTLGLIRILLGSLFFWDIAVLGLDLHDYFGSEGWIGPEAVQQYLAEHTPHAWSFWFYVPDRWLVPAWACCLLVVFLFAIGFASRITAVLAWAIAISTVRRAPVALFGFDYMIATWSFYLAAFGASGQALSVDHFLGTRRTRPRSTSPGTRSYGPAPSISANLTLRALQLHLAFIYGAAGLSKLMGTEWWNGTAIQMIMLTPEFRRFDLVWLAAYPGLLSIATHAGLFLEIAYPVVIWVRKLRPLLLASVILLHVGNDFMLGLTEFGLTMIAANLSFVSGEWLRVCFSPTLPRAASTARNGRIKELQGEISRSIARHGGQRVSSS
jgi:Vitamin K-dependent gamma-carboxylase